jgi:uncharacterized membrane protein (DUF106 family)
VEQDSQLLEILKEIKQNQRVQLEGQKEALSLQREQYEMARRQFDRAEKIQDRAEEIQNSGASMMRTARRVLAIILPVVIGLVIYLSWLIFR